MATPLNVFRTYTAELTTNNEIIYTVPENNTGIVLMAQVANVSANTAAVTFAHYNSTADVETELVKDYEIPGNDASSVITGKLVIQEGDSVKAQSSANDTFKITLSILESLNA